MRELACQEHSALLELGNLSYVFVANFIFSSAAHMFSFANFSKKGPMSFDVALLLLAV